MSAMQRIGGIVNESEQAVIQAAESIVSKAAGDHGPMGVWLRLLLALVVVAGPVWVVVGIVLVTVTLMGR